MGSLFWVLSPFIYLLGFTYVASRESEWRWGVSRMGVCGSVGPGLGTISASVSVQGYYVSCALVAGEDAFRRNRRRKMSIDVQNHTFRQGKWSAVIFPGARWDFGREETLL